MLKRSLSMLLAFGLLLPGAAFADEALSRSLTKQLEVNRQRYGIAGQALLVAHNGEVIFRGVDGEADVETHRLLKADDVFHGYSLSKLFVSTLILQLVEQGEVDLDKPASAYLPGLPARWRAISVRDFLEHASGVPEYFDTRQGEITSDAKFSADLQTVFASLAEAPMQFAPGAETRYTQTNYLVLAALLAAHYGKPYPKVAEERIIRKLGLRHTWLGPAALSKQSLAVPYLGKNGRLEKDQDIPWPEYAYGHAELFITLDDLARFLQAVASGELVGKATLNRAWQPRTLRNGQRGWFASGWEYGESGAYRQVGHDGGARDRIRILFKNSLEGDVYLFAYLTNGSARGVWTRTLLDSAMAATAPDRFPVQAVSETLMGYALQQSAGSDAQAQAESIRARSGLDATELERTVNNTGYAIRENLGVVPALRVFELNTVLFPDSANTWDSLAEAYAAQGDRKKAKALYDKAQRLSARSKRAP
ncbi:beta-lactamase family protein [Luteimonas gilva]|uniref:Beta-lactamase family protein n=1 Tax=Luteimonas gilva TaxID=2572684 RepID=A0A4U5JMV4_9GAMM|nr:beta-lactamase family protein [Luteimonas gilva]